MAIILPNTQSCPKKKLEAHTGKEGTRDGWVINWAADSYVTEAWLYEQAHNDQTDKH